ncbi:hypothetical protein KUTeg_001818 [Tegillarca granosa]|uniref:Uncharacterized protein n=1 Tax=Tegillarca granosa TaxID=220873 RepID=A0ABQ9FVP9_TEGGR|nr:hypothetical protein KUTeg_001818 [Tegillarca granosa]
MTLQYFNEMLSAVFAHQVVIVLASSQCGFRYVENPEIPGVCCDPVFDCPAGHQIIQFILGIEAMERKSAVLTTAHKSPSITTSSSASSVSVSSNSNSANSNGNTDKPKTTGMEVVVVTNSSLSVGLVVENKQDELVNLKILIGILIPLMFITVIACIILYIKRGKLFCLNLVRHRNERRNVPAANGNVVRYNAVPPDVERNGNAIRDRNNVTESSLSTFPPIDSVPDQSDSVKQTAQCNHYAAEQNDSGPQSNHVIPYQSASLTPPQSSQFDTYGNDATPLVQPGNQPLRVKITPQTNIAANLQTPTPTRTSPSSDSSATIATPMDHDSHSEMVPSASPFQMYPAAHPLSGATYDALKNDSGCFSTATERLSSAAQSNNFRIRLPEEGENDTEVKQQDNYECNHDNSHEGS